MNKMVENRITQAFKQQEGAAFIPFVTAGDPNLEITKKLIVTMADAGAAIIEIGIPFSDPVAEGIVIQEASERALKENTTTDNIFRMVTQVRQQVTIPLVFMTYFNPVFTYGCEKFMKQCEQVGIDGIIIPDLPYEEKGELLPICEKYGISLISLVTPTSKERIITIAKEAQGFLYCVSSLGVTGVRSNIEFNVKELLAVAKEYAKVPCAIGFGISTPEQAKELAKYGDGIIVGSAIVKIVGKHKENSPIFVKEYVKKMVDGCKK